MTCLAPTGDGHLLLTGSVHAIAANPDPALSLELNNVPVAWALDGIRLVRAGFGNSLIATGSIDGNFTYASPGSKSAAGNNPELRGQATVNQFTITGPALQKPLALPVLRLAMNAGSPPQTHRGHGVPAPAVNNNELLLEPFVVGSSPVQVAATPAAKLPASMTVSGAFARNGFSMHLGGESSLGELIALGKEIGLLQRIPADVGNQGTADLDLTVHGPWMLPVTDQPVAPAAVDGTLRLHNAQLSGDFLAQPVRIPAAQAVFAGNEITWTASGMIYGPLHADGTLSYPTFCGIPTGCVHHFGLHLAVLDAETAQNALLGAQRHGELIERLLDRLRSLNRSTPSWPILTGSVQIGALTIQSLALKDFTSVVAVEGHTIQLKSSTARTLDGQLHLSGSMEVADHMPHYQLEVQLDDASARSTGAVFAENWGPGSINLQASLKFSGFEQKDLLSSATGTFHGEWTNGGLPTPPASSGKVGSGIGGVVNRFDAWKADGVIANSALNLQDSQIFHGDDATPLTGTISFARELNLSSVDKNDPVKITGTLQHPLVQTEPIVAANSTKP